MYKLATLLITALLLISLLAGDASARSLQGAFPGTILNQKTEIHKELQGEEAVVAGEDRCEDLSEDECLMRRSLVAHLDYIYTQKHNKP